MSYALLDLVDLKMVRSFFHHFAALTGYGCSLMDQASGEIVIAEGWSDICENFHRQHRTTSRNCRKARTLHTSETGDREEPRLVRCDNGLVEGIIPVFIEGRHMANIALGQVLLGPPDHSLFSSQAEACGFDTKAYLNALARIPVVEEVQFRQALYCMAEVAGLISSMGLAAVRAKELDEANNALKFLLQQTNDAKSDIEKNITANIKGLILPHLIDLDNLVSGKREKEHIAAIKENLNRVTAPFSRHLAKEAASLTPREMQVADMVRLGRTNKEIAEILGISARTVESYRDALRRKLNLKNKKVNLRSYLMSIGIS